MSVQQDLDAATAATVASTQALQAATAQLVALNIEPPANTAPLVAAVAAQTQAVTDLQNAVTTEAGKLNPPAPAAS